MRGKVLEKEEKEDGQQWTPYNANMSMQGIKVSKVLVIFTHICILAPKRGRGRIAYVAVSASVII